MHQGQISVTKEQIGRAKKCVSFTTATIGSKRSEAEKAKLWTVGFNHKIGCEHIQEYSKKCNQQPDFSLFQWIQWISLCTICTIKIMNAKKWGLSRPPCASHYACRSSWLELWISCVKLEGWLVLAWCWVMYGSTSSKRNTFALACFTAFSAPQTSLMEIGATCQCRISTVIDSTDSRFVTCIERENLPLACKWLYT